MREYEFCHYCHDCKHLYSDYEQWGLSFDDECPRCGSRDTSVCNEENGDPREVNTEPVASDEADTILTPHLE